MTCVAPPRPDYTPRLDDMPPGPAGVDGRLWDAPQAAARIAADMAARYNRSGAAHALEALARYRAGHVDRRTFALLDKAVRLVETSPDRLTEQWIGQLSTALERSWDVDGRAANWIAAAAGGASTVAMCEEGAWLAYLAEPDCAQALLAAGGGAELPNVHPVARVSWYSVLAAAAGSATAAVRWARRAQRSGWSLAADTGRPLRAGHVYLAWTWARLTAAPDDAAGWAIMAANSFDTIGDQLNAAWAHLNAAAALTVAGRSGPARTEQQQARALLEPHSFDLFPLLHRRAEAAVPSRNGGRGPTRRERAVLELLADGLTAEAIARQLGISPRTVHHHLEHLYRKLGTRDRLVTVRRAEALGLL